MNKYNKCEGCKLWNDHYCTGARSYEPNADEHRAICNEHMAKQFWVVYQQLHRSETRIKELEEENNHLVDVNKKVERKLEIAKEALQYYADGEDMSEAKIQGSDAWRYVVDDNHTDIAQQALQKIKEVNNVNIHS